MTHDQPVRSIADLDLPALETRAEILVKVLERGFREQQTYLQIPQIVPDGLGLPLGEALKLTLADIDRTLRAVRDQRGDVLIELRKRAA